MNDQNGLAFEYACINLTKIFGEGPERNYLYLEAT